MSSTMISSSAHVGDMEARMEALTERVAMLERQVAAGVPKPKKEKAVKEPKEKAPKKEKAPAPALPEASADGAPDESEYRFPEEDVDHTTCVGRRFTQEDKRWKPAVFGETQCGKAVKEGCDLCTTCANRLERYAAAPKPGPWLGRITEEPPSWAHMLGTDWAAEKEPKWRGVASDSAAASEASSVSEASAPVAASVTSKKSAVSAAEKEAKKAAKEKEREEKKAAATAAKEAEKEAKKAAKEAEKEAKKAAAAAEKEAAKKAKEAEKEKAKAEKAAEKEKAKAAKPAAKEKPAAKKAVAAAAPAKADTSAPVETVEGELKLIAGTMYMVRNGNVYDYNEMEESAGDFVGRLAADGESIDTDAEEVKETESESE
jgi:histone H1/5